MSLTSADCHLVTYLLYCGAVAWEPKNRIKLYVWILQNTDDSESIFDEIRQSQIYLIWWVNSNQYLNFYFIVVFSKIISKSIDQWFWYIIILIKTIKAHYKETSPIVVEVGVPLSMWLVFKHAILAILIRVGNGIFGMER